jgi:DNA-binding NarL/FixJ family response regulator
LTLRVLLVEDETLVRQGIRGLLELDPRFAIAGEAADGEEALRLIAATRPDVVLLDVRMPKLDGLGVLRALRETAAAPPPCLVLTTFDDRALALAAIREGARGYLRKDVTLPELIAAVETLAGGGTHLQPALTRALRTGAAEGPLASHAAAAPAEPLTPRETEVLRLMAAAYTNREIAAALGTAEGTVKVQVSNVLAKLAARDRTHAVLLALELRIL